ncbi:MAG: hypothetical protein CMG66_06065 [Candidatus Marinimicrobia bacterium]|nr:hypothetical protein [Candidatus Neomarinimicrobiota bacterium]|tara:strand:+ start:64 stop:363 length:300 start_codon:yes stop_codon:yes gene_type:complete
MIVYEVNLSVNGSIYDEYRKWLKNHIEKMLTFKGFYKYKMYTVSSDCLNQKEICIHYYIESLEDLEYYFDNYAEKMRLEGIELFKNNFSASRRILSVLK